MGRPIENGKVTAARIRAESITSDKLASRAVARCHTRRRFLWTPITIPLWVLLALLVITAIQITAFAIIVLAAT